MSMIVLIVLLTIFTSVFVLINFVLYIGDGRIVANKRLWNAIQLWTVVILPVFFLSTTDLPYNNECCTDTAIFSPGHRLAIYSLIFLSMSAIVVNMFRKRIFPPIIELLVNIFLIQGLILNIIFCKHFNTTDEGPIWWLFGNIPIIFIYIIALAKNHKLLKEYIATNESISGSALTRFCTSILRLRSIFKYPAMTILMAPVTILVLLFLILFGQQPDSIIRAFTDTYRHGFSKIDYLCDNVNCGGHFLCSVGAKGHREIVKPLRYGERNGTKILCNRQLLISNAFEELLQEKFPTLHYHLRRNYNKVGNLIHRYYFIFNNKFISDVVYILMKPLEIFFLLILYLFDQKPENRIAIQYLKKGDKENIKKCEARYVASTIRT